jgi:hypothetical protein
MVRAVQDLVVPLVSSDMGIARYRELGFDPTRNISIAALAGTAA